jgi:thioredoxin reductase (NADPH)
MGTFLDDALRDTYVPYRDPKEDPHRAVTGPELMELMRQQSKNFGTRIITDDVVKVDLGTHPFKLKTRGGQELESLAVIIATGARANYLGLESEDRFKNAGVSACAVCDGALPRFRNKPLVVVGGGDSAMEESSYLTKFGSKVYIIHRRDAFRASQIMADRVLANEKIEVKWNTVVEEVLGNDKDGVTGVKIRSSVTENETEELEAGGYFAAIGHTPNTDFLQGQLETTSKGYLVWTKPFRTNTSKEGVFAAGDVADDYYRQAITAAGSGCMAALDAERWLASKGFE